MAGGTKRLPRAVREQQMLDAAVQMFSVNGYHETSMDAIAALAGLALPLQAAELARRVVCGPAGRVMIIAVAADHAAAPGAAPNVAPGHLNQEVHRCTGLVLNTVRSGHAAAASAISTITPAWVNVIHGSRLGGRMGSQPCCSMAAATSPCRRSG